MIKYKTLENFKIRERIPKGPQINLSLLVVLRDEQSYTMNEITEILQVHFKLSKKEKEALKPSGKETIFHNRVHWAKYNLKLGGLITDVNKGTIMITQKGKDLLKTNPNFIDTRPFRNTP